MCQYSSANDESNGLWRGEQKAAGGGDQCVRLSIPKNNINLIYI